MLKFLQKFLLGLLFILFSNSLNAQTFGFGCLGFVGGFGGYSYQKYNPKGLNNYISVFNQKRGDSLKNSMSNFGNASGYRVGINFFRANFTGFILTSKGFYQSLIENNKSSSALPAGNSTTNLEVKLNSWGLGIDLGTSITESVSWKVIEASLLFK